MTTLREAAQMALDVLDDINQCSLPPTGIPLPAEIDEAMDSLREALAQPPCATGAQCVGGKCEQCAVQEREWVGLTDEERKEVIRQQKDFWGPVGWELECVRAIEAKLREKNFDRPS